MAHCGSAGKPHSAGKPQHLCPLAYQTLTSLKMHRRACCCDRQVLENSSAQLQQQLAQKGTQLSSAEQSLAHLKQKLSQSQHSTHEATKVKLVSCLHHDKHPCIWCIWQLGCITAFAYPPSRCVCCANICSVRIVSALREDDCCIMLQAESYAGCLTSSARGSGTISSSASGAAGPEGC